MTDTIEEEEAIGFQFFDDLGEGLTEVLDEFYGGEAFVVASKIIDWLKNRAGIEVYAEIDAMIHQHGHIELANYSSHIGWLRRYYATHINEALDDAGLPRLMPADDRGPLDKP